MPLKVKKINNAKQLKGRSAIKQKSNKSGCK